MIYPKRTTDFGAESAGIEKKKISPVFFSALSETGNDPVKQNRTFNIFFSRRCHEKTFRMKRSKKGRIFGSI